MRIRSLSMALLMCIGSANLARADPYTILPSGELAFNVVLTTSGVFTCLRGNPTPSPSAPERTRQRSRSWA